MNKINFKVPLALGLVGAGLLATGAPAQAVAVQYVFSGANFNAGALTGDFFFDTAGATPELRLPSYTITSSSTNASASTLTYTPSNSAVTSASSTGFFLTVDPGFFGTSVNGPVTARTLEVLFQTALGLIGSSTPLDTTLPNPRSQEILDINNGADVVTRNVLSGASVTAIPLETDALPVAATMAVVGGMLWHRNRKRSRVTLDLTPSAQTQKV